MIRIGFKSRYNKEQIDYFAKRIRKYLIEQEGLENPRDFSIIYGYE